MFFDKVLVALFLITLVTCSEIDVFKSILNNNLERFNTKASPLSGPKISLTPSKTSKFPLDVYIEICDFLSLTDLLKFSGTCRDTFIAMEMSVVLKLARINPHYVFNEHLINLMIYKLIEGNKLEPDDLELITFKYITNNQRKVTDLAILEFLHKTVYGLNVPLNQKDWRISFIRRIKSFHMPKTKTFVNKYYEKHPESLNYDVSTWIELIEFFANKPTLLDQTNFRNSFNQHSQNHYTAALTIPDEFEIIFNENSKV